MADRILTWYIESLVGDGTSAGPVFVMDRDYRPHVVRVHAKRCPDAGHLSLDVKDDGVSIFGLLPKLTKGQTSEDVAEDFQPNADTIAKYSLVSLDLNSSGASGITVQLELEAEADSEVEESDT